MRYLYLILISIVIVSCNTTTEDTETDNIIVETDDKTISTESHTKIVKKIFYNVPSPIEISTLLKDVGSEYNANYLNSYKKVNEYTTNEEMSLNLGIYGADLSYNRLFDQIQESVNYFSSIKKLSDNLGIPQENGGAAAERLETNLENKDSLLTIISQTYSEADMYLKMNERGSTASLIILGGWIEALYIGTQIAKTSEGNLKLINNIAEQKFSLDNLIGLLSNYKDDEVVSKYLLQLADLKESYDKVEIKYTRNEVKTDHEKGLTTIDNKSQITISNETFVEIMMKIEIIRKNII